MPVWTVTLIGPYNQFKVSQGKLYQKMKNIFYLKIIKKYRVVFVHFFFKLHTECVENGNILVISIVFTSIIFK